uniref:t-SNARE coiled-coil homology domain-containing protein n=1 Tax=Babesia bovis TaxID=5865 RepID=S6AYY8_BABBO|nr:hypothetical protein [Babesia bovis]
MATTDMAMRDPYDEAENTVRKNIRKLILLQSQVLEELRTMPPNTPLTSTSKGSELLNVCSAIERDISELQKVIDTISNNRERYRITKKIIAQRQSNIDEFRSKIKGVHDRNRQATTPDNPQPAICSSSFAQHQLMSQKDMLDQQDAHIIVLNASAQNLHQNARAINVEVTNQNALLSEVGDAFDETNLRLNALTKRMAVFLDTKNPSLLRLVITLFLISIVLLLFIILL